MKTLVFVLVSSMTLFSCASHHGDKIAVPNPKSSLKKPNKKLVVSAEKIKELSDKSHTMIVITFENKSEDWTRFKASTFSCGQECDLNTNIILGQDLNTWMKSQYHKRTISQHNNALYYTGAIILGTAASIIGGSSGSDGLAVAGGAAYAGGAGMAIYDSFKETQLATKTGKLDPQSDHIYNPFAVPSSGFAKRWILIHTPRNQKITTIDLKFENEGGEVESYTVSL